MNHAKIRIKEEDVVKLVLEFFSSRSLHVSMRTLEKETGIVNNLYSEEVLFLRELILDGDWEEVLLFAQPFENLNEFNSKQFKYLVLKQKFIELLSVKSHVVGKQSTNTIEEVMQTLQKLEETCPSKEEYSNLCWLLTVPNLIEQNEFREWTIDNSRLKCFKLILEVIGSVIPSERKSKKKSNCANRGRLLQLIINGLLYETCIELCQVKAIESGNESFREVLVRTNVLQGSGDGNTANLFSWLRSLDHKVFNNPFEQLSFDVNFEKLAKYHNNPRHSVDSTVHNTRQKPSMNDLTFRSLDNFDKVLSSKNIKQDPRDFVRETNLINGEKTQYVNKKIVDDDFVLGGNKSRVVHSDGGTINQTSKQSMNEIISEPEILFDRKTTTPHHSTNNVKTTTPQTMSSNRHRKVDDRSNMKQFQKPVDIVEPKNVPETALRDEDSDMVNFERDFHVEKEKQRVSVLQKLNEYESRKQMMQKMIQEQQQHQMSSRIGDGGIFQPAKETEMTQNPTEKINFNEVTPKKKMNFVNLADGSGRINTSTPKPKTSIKETPPPDASPVSRINGDHHRATASKGVVRKYKSKEEPLNSHGKENEPKDTEINRKGPMINGVRRALSSPPLISLPAEEPVSRPIEKQTKLNGKSQFKVISNANNPEKETEMVKAPVVKNELPPAAKGPGPKIKTRDGSKVYVTELLKSREEIKNASASNQAQEQAVIEERNTTKKPPVNTEVANGQESLSFSPVCMLEDSQAIRAVCFHPDGRLFAVGANSKVLRVCQFDNYRQVVNNVNEPLPQPSVVFKRNKYHKGSIYCMAWNPLGDVIATGSNDKSIKLLRFNPDTCVQEGGESDIFIHNGTVRELAFVPDKTEILVSGGAGDGAVQITDCTTCQTIGTLRGHSGNVMSVYAGLGDIIATGSTDNTLRLWDLRSHRCIDVILVGDSSPASVALNRDGSFLASGQEDGCILLYDISAGRTLQSFRLHQEDCRSVRFSPDSQHLLTGSYDTEISLLHAKGNLETTLPTHYKIASHKDKVIQCRWHPRRSAFLSSSADRTVVLWSSSSQHDNLHFS